MKNKKDFKLSIKWFSLMLVSVLIFLIISPIAFISQVTFRVFHNDYDLWYYFKAIAVGLDALGGSIIYGSKLHTISGMSGYFECITTYKSSLIKYITIWHSKVQAPFIDFLFSKNHCYRTAIKEKLVNNCVSKDKK